MAVHSLGTTSTTAISKAIKWTPGTDGTIAPADMATIAQAIKNDLVNTNPIVPGAFSYNGILYIPNRNVGYLTALPGDVIAVDNTGWPILVSKNSINYGSSNWVFT